MLFDLPPFLDLYKSTKNGLLDSVEFSFYKQGGLFQEYMRKTVFYIFSHSLYNVMTLHHSEGEVTGLKFGTSR
ncbi:hypothetical protein C4A75_08760 [Brevibacillus laterosporus]|nr:hypothetical protein C4A75_08760 [Brevibacillus laterosporus]